MSLTWWKNCRGGRRWRSERSASRRSCRAKASWCSARSTSQQCSDSGSTGVSRSSSAGGAPVGAEAPKHSDATRKARTTPAGRLLAGAIGLSSTPRSRSKARAAPADPPARNSASTPSSIAPRSFNFLIDSRSLCRAPFVTPGIVDNLHQQV